MSFARSVRAAARLLLLVSTISGALATVAGAQVTQAEYAARRAAFAKSLTADGVILVLGNREPKENFQNFWQSEHFNYLTGFLEPAAAMVMVKKGDTVEQFLFVEPRDPAQEVWTGARLGVEGVKPKTGMSGRTASTLRATLDSLLAQGGNLFTVGDLSRGGGADVPGSTAIRTADDQFVDQLKLAHRNVTVSDAGNQVNRLRGAKSAAELALIRTAAQVSAKAHVQAMHAIAPDLAEFEIQALAEYTFRRNGADGPSYGSIVGSGPNSTTLHYNKDDRFMKAGEMVNMDMAAYYGGYSADITRTVPVNGTFTPAQKDIYQIVLDAQMAAERQVKPGTHFATLNDSATAVLRNGLTKVGLMESPNATYDCGNGRSCTQLSLYYMHGLGHPIGLDVHDVDVGFASTAPLAVGSAFTIEPGIYVRENLLAIIPDTPKNTELRVKVAAGLKKYANIGVRVEDDYIVTATGFERPTSEAPRTIADIEKEMAKKGPIPARDAATVEAYKKIRP